MTIFQRSKQSRRRLAEPLDRHAGLWPARDDYLPALEASGRRLAEPLDRHADLWPARDDYLPAPEAFRSQLLAPSAQLFSSMPVPVSRQRAWIPLGISAAVHLLLIALVAELTRRPDPRDPAERRDRPTSEARRIDMVYVPPAGVPAQPRPARPPLPTPPPRKTAPEPEPNAPPEATRSKGAETPPESGPSRKDEAAEASPQPKVEAPAAAREATLESEARRIFGRPRPLPTAGAGPQAVRPMEAWVADRPERCVPHPVPPGDSGAAALGTVVGRIFRQDNGRPLAGAHLQMIGTPYVTFTDGNGEYRFRFDRALVDNCRTLYVRVSAAGYESRLLVLVVGPNARSEDVRLRRQ